MQLKRKKKKTIIHQIKNITTWQNHQFCVHYKVKTCTV